jgi:hypothetical protein
MSHRALASVATLLALLAVLAVVLIGGDDQPSPPTLTTPSAAEVPPIAKVDGPDADGKLDDTIRPNPQVAERIEDELDGTAGEAVSELSEPLRQPNDTPATTTIPGPLAADEVPGCRTRFVGNSSSRNGARPQIIYLHQTVSRERGWASQDSLTGLASRRSSGVSWHLLVGRSDGRCTYTVPLALKAWTQANANPWGVGIEVEAYGDEGAYVVGAGKDRLVSVVRHVARRYDIPLRRGAVDGDCRPTRSGLLEHSDAGRCGGGHIDVTLQPSDAASFIAQLAAGGAVTATDRVTCRKLNWWRARGRPHGAPERNAIRRRQALARRGVRCTARGPVR